MTLSMKKDKAEARRERLIEKHRYINHDFFEADYTIDDHIDMLARQGVWVDPKAVHWSVGWCESDDANYPYSIGCDDMTKFMRRNGLRKQFPAVWWWAKRARRSVEVGGSRSHLGGSRSYISIEVIDRDVYDTVYDADDEAEVDPSQELIAGILNVKKDQYDAECRGFEERVKQIMKDHMHDLYVLLRDELEYLSSDEAVWETIEANGLDEDDEEDDDDDE